MPESRSPPRFGRLRGRQTTRGLPSVIAGMKETDR